MNTCHLEDRKAGKSSISKVFWARDMLVSSTGNIFGGKIPYLKTALLFFVCFFSPPEEKNTWTENFVLIPKPYMKFISAKLASKIQTKKNIMNRYISLDKLDKMAPIPKPSFPYNLANGKLDHQELPPQKRYYFLIGKYIFQLQPSFFEGQAVDLWGGSVSSNLRLSL